MNDLSHTDLRSMPYAAFLNTKYWRSVRSEKITQAEGKCEYCGCALSLQVHHKTYENHGREHEHLDDLVVLCADCHKREHFPIPRDDIRAAVMAANVSFKAKVLGLKMADHWSSNRCRVRLRLEKLSDVIGKSRITTIRGINELVKENVFIRVRTGRASIYYAGSAVGKK